MVLTFSLSEAIMVATLVAGFGGLIWRVSHMEKRLARIERRLFSEDR